MSIGIVIMSSTKRETTIPGKYLPEVHRRHQLGGPARRAERKKRREGKNPAWLDVVRWEILQNLSKHGIYTDGI